MRRLVRYPRPRWDNASISCRVFRDRYGEQLKSDQEHADRVRVHGRIARVRKASSKLAFVDIVDNGTPLQVLVNARRTGNGLEKLSRGDAISAYGVPSRSSTGELSLTAEEQPTLLSQCLHDLPIALDNRYKNRHVDLLISPKSGQILRLRSEIIQQMRDFFRKDGFMEVQTPLLAASAGGAIARPFVTQATEFKERNLELRIAPELWLKRLVVGGLERVFEIGPVFRNEGIDATHNPEFTTCEFYKAFADLEMLISMTEEMLSGLGSLQLHEDIDWSAPFQRLDFIETIERAVGKLPDLAADDAAEKLAAMGLGTGSNVIRTLDKLLEQHIEPLCKQPTLIMHHPAALSPLAKSYRRESDRQLVSARFELVVQGKELVNAYEEENDPAEQRRKFELQAQAKSLSTLADIDSADPPMSIDESYVKALEYGLPPTGGWGIGVDRLVMLLSGASRIEEVLPFGNLRHVINT